MGSKSDDSDFTEGTRMAQRHAVRKVPMQRFLAETSKTHLSPRRSARNNPTEEHKAKQMLEVEDPKGKRQRKEVAEEQEEETGGPAKKKMHRTRRPSVRARRKKTPVDDHEDESAEVDGDKDFDAKDDAADEDFGAPVRPRLILICFL